MLRFAQTVRRRPLTLIVLAVAACMPVVTAVRADAGTRPVGARALHDGSRAAIPFITAGLAHRCALIDGDVSCWGQNDVGQLGNGSTRDSAFPTDASVSAIAISAGWNHTCAIDFSVSCWGQNDEGQLGDGTTTDAWRPVSVVGFGSRAVAVAAGRQHTCALATSGTVRCWGNNVFGQLGNGTTSDSLSPVQVSGLAGVVGISAGGDHTCAVMADGGVRCWGRNTWGQLGNGTTNDATTPVAVIRLVGVTTVTGGLGHTCAVSADGTPRCWGRNDRGQLGITSQAHATVPTRVYGLSGVAGIAAGAAGSHTCAFTAMGVGGANPAYTWCWGSGASGALGNGTTTTSTKPVSVKLIGGVAAITAGNASSCALALSQVGSVMCWGTGPLGDGNWSSSAVPVIASRVQFERVRAVGLSVGRTHSCVVLTRTQAKCWGHNADGRLGSNDAVAHSEPVSVYNIQAAVGVAAGGQHGCVLVSARPRCWGNNARGQLGDGTTTSTLSSHLVKLPHNTVSIVAGGEHSCALAVDGIVRCWGSNASGQLGIGTSIGGSTIPIEVDDLGSAIAISTSEAHTCALLVGGTVKCWGANGSGQVGLAPSTPIVDAPTTVDGVVGAVAISAGVHHTCALLSNATAKCWGRNAEGQLGRGTTSLAAPVPRPVKLPAIVAISAGGTHTCAVADTGHAYCWGQGSYGRLGNGSTANRTLPVEVEYISDAVAIGTANLHSCAVSATGHVRCWGRNKFHELGNGSTTDSALPVNVRLTASSSPR